MAFFLLQTLQDAIKGLIYLYIDTFTIYSFMKTSLIFIVFLLAALSVNAQFSGGIKGGANFARLESDFLTTDSETSFYGGIFVAYDINERFAIQPEAYYLHQEGNENGFDYSFDYIAVPLVLKVKFSPVNIYAGGHFGFLLNVDATLVEKEDFKGIAVSGTLGAGVDILPVLEAGGRYVHGLSDISNNVYIKDVKFRMWEVYIAWRIFGK